VEEIGKLGKLGKLGEIFVCSKGFSLISQKKGRPQPIERNEIVN
jgi:hypothetical protein